MVNNVNKISINGEVCNIEDSRLVTPNTGHIGVDIHTLALGSCTLQVTRADDSPSITIGERVRIGDGVTIQSGIDITKDSLNGMTDVEWTSESDMNDFRAKGSYYIHGIKTKADDRLPINTVNSGASFAAHLTVVDGSLQPSDGSTPTEICVTQFLMLSNRLGGDGNMYFRTYNEPKNVEAGKGIWTDWKRMSGSVEGYIFSNTKKMNIDFGYQDKEVGLNYMVDNGTYQGVYINDEALTYQEGSYNAETGNGIASLDPTKIAYVETFIITTINDYAATAQVNQMLGSLGMPQKTRQICQFKQATNVLTGTSSYQKRTCLGNGGEYKTASNWSDWADISGGGSNEIELDADTILDAINDQGYTIKDFISIGLIKDNITYVLNVPNSYWTKVGTFFSSKSLRKYFEGGGTADSKSELKIIYRKHYDCPILWIEGYNAAGDYYIISIKNPREDTEVIKVSTPMTVLE